MNTKEIEFVIAHEILHCVFDHMKRREDREPQLHNIACDYIVNNTLMDQNIGEKPKDIQIFQDYNLCPETAKHHTADASAPPFPKSSPQTGSGQDKSRKNYIVPYSRPASPPQLPT